MKIYFSTLILLIFTFSYSQQVASCCNTERGCTGSSYCTACSNCSGCKHCAKNGGTCGVCSGGNYKPYSASKPKKRNSSSTTTHNLSSSQPKSTFNTGDYLYVSVKELNVRKKPDSKSTILEKAKMNDKLKYLKTVGSWYKVEVTKSKTIGYIYFKYVK